MKKARGRSVLVFKNIAIVGVVLLAAIFFFSFKSPSKRDCKVKQIPVSAWLNQFIEPLGSTLKGAYEVCDIRSEWDVQVYEFTYEAVFNVPACVDVLDGSNGSYKQHQDNLKKDIAGIDIEDITIYLTGRCEGDDSLASGRTLSYLVDGKDSDHKSKRVLIVFYPTIGGEFSY